MNELFKIIGYIGFYGPFVLSIIVVYSIIKQPPYVISYIVGYFINLQLDIYLKSIFKQNRPSGPIQLFENENELYKDSVQYGFPSGHTLIALYSITYLYLMFKKINRIVLFSMFLGIITIYQRWIYRRHTMEQLFAGSVIGILMAFIIFNLTGKYVKTDNTKEKMVL